MDKMILRCLVLLLILIKLSTALLMGGLESRNKRDLSKKQWMYVCKEYFIDGRDNDRCSAWKNYISCLIRSVANSPDYFDSNEIKQIIAYKNSLNDTCELTDTCLCEYHFLTYSYTAYSKDGERFHMGVHYKSRHFRRYLHCLENSLMPSCDGTMEPKSMLRDADMYKYKYESTRSCSRYQGSKCYNVENYVDCLEHEPVMKDRFPLNSRDASNLLSSVNSIQYCEIYMSDSCLCELKYVTADTSTDVKKCKTASDYSSCLETAYMRGCNDVHLEILQESASLAMSKYCPADTFGNCSGVHKCHIDMTALSTATVESTTTSCSSLFAYMECLSTNVSPDCPSAAAAMKMIQKLYDDKYKCASLLDTEDSCACDSKTNSNGKTGTGSGTNSNAVPVVKINTNNGNLAAYLHDAKLEAKETLHEAQETLDAIADTEKIG